MEHFHVGKESAVKALFRGYVNNFRKNLPWRLTISFVISLGVFLLYAFLAAYVNEGLSDHSDGPLSKGWFLRYIVMLEGSEPVQWVYSIRTAAAFLALPMFCLLLARCFSKIFTIGIGGFIKSIIWNFPQYIDDLRYRHSSTIMLIGAVLGATLGALIQNPVFLLMLSILVYLSAAAREKSLLINLLFVVWHDTLLLLKRKDVKVFYIDLVGAYLRGTALGLLMMAVLGILIPHGYLYFLPSLALIILTVIKLTPGLFRKSSSSQAGMFLLCLVVFVLMVFNGAALAHDGGWIEGGGNLWDWLRSDGAMRVLLSALAVAALCYLSLSLGGLPLIGAIKGVVELSTGKDMITGMPLTGFDKAMAIGGLLPLCATGKVITQVGSMMSAFGNIGDAIGKGMSGALSGDYGSSDGLAGHSNGGCSDTGEGIGNSFGSGKDWNKDIPRPDEDDDSE